MSEASRDRTAGVTTNVGIDVRERSRDRVVVAIAGEIDLATSPFLSEALSCYERCDVVVDLGAVRILDASGLAVLIRTRQRLRRTGHALRTTGERGGVLAAITAVGLVDAFHPSSEHEP